MNFPIKSITIRQGIRQISGSPESFLELMDSMRQFGLIHPIVVQRDGTLVVGERRLAAAERLGWETIPARIWENLSDEERLRIQVEENLRRKELEQEERRRAIELVQKRKEMARKMEGHGGEFRIRADTKTNTGRGRPVEVGSFREHASFLGTGTTTLLRRSIENEMLNRFPFLSGWPQRKLIELHNFLRDHQVDEQHVLAVLNTYKDDPKVALSELRSVKPVQVQQETVKREVVTRPAPEPVPVSRPVPQPVPVPRPVPEPTLPPVPQPVPQLAPSAAEQAKDSVVRQALSKVSLIESYALEAEAALKSIADDDDVTKSLASLARIVQEAKLIRSIWEGKLQ